MTNLRYCTVHGYFDIDFAVKTCVNAHYIGFFIGVWSVRERGDGGFQNFK